jgi:hypothetical protein
LHSPGPLGFDGGAGTLSSGPFPYIFEEFHVIYSDPQGAVIIGSGRDQGSEQAEVGRTGIFQGGPDTQSICTVLFSGSQILNGGNRLCENQ